MSASSRRFAVTDEDGKLDEAVIPLTIPRLVNGVLPADVIPGGVGGAQASPEVWDWVWPGTLSVRAGLGRRVVPPAAYLAQFPRKRIRPFLLVTTLGLFASPNHPNGTTVRFRLLVNAVPRMEWPGSETNFRHPSMPQANFDQTPFEAEDVITMDIIQTPAPAAGYTSPADATVSLYWEWIE
ncbi:hypothetical protein M3D75_11645 [Microbacterium enclense]|uniref:hypothetical protein n=1 Tax=Microbacterium enclense TaxID=993073 RepID=UPI0021A671C4|nr:hypothetical protein [Microbacterium enclense]MCT2086770.1 hypothetical protein [Microbacterium enclense]